MLGAKEVFGVDVDGVAVRVAQKNAEKMGVKEKTHWTVAGVDVVKGAFDTVLQNPPFGVQRRRADRRFISKSLELSSTIYSFHKGGESNREFIKRFIERHGGRVTNIFPLKMEIPRMFKFHTKKKKITQVDLYRVEGKVHERT
jgi:putative methylase